MQQPYIELRDLRRGYGKREAVRGISLGIERGEIVGLLGPNGAGKSTTISMLAGLLSPTGGDILWEGASLRGRMREWRRAIGVVLEDLALFEYLGVREHLDLCARLAGFSAAESDRRVAELLDFFQLGDAAGTVAAEASQGTRKKLAFALSLVHAPRVLLLDEALNGIDAVTVHHVKALLRRLAGGGVTVVISSHVLDSAETLIDRCVIVDRGVVALDTPMAAIRASGRSLEQAYTDALEAGRPAPPELTWAE
ncbi:MAG TPA: ABC transporter ATP-binding protein [Spirochaetia bacterium]